MGSTILFVFLIVIIAFYAIKAVRKIAEKKAEKEEKRIAEEKKQAAAAERKRREEEYMGVLDAIPAVDIRLSDKPATKNSVDDIYDLTFSSVTKKSKLEKLCNFVVIDTETTGLAASKAEILEIAAIRFRDWEPVEKFVTLCSTKKPIPVETVRINGITEEMVAGKPQFGYVADALKEFIGTDNVVGHNLEFDLKFITKHGVYLEPEKRKCFDTLYLAEHTLKKAKDKWDKEIGGYVTNFDIDFDVYDFKLATLCIYYGIPHFDAHRALADCYSTGLLFKELAEARVEN